MTREYVARPDNDVMWSSWRDTEHALGELDGILVALEAGAPLLSHQIAVVFAATGPTHELAVSSGWSAEFGALGDEVDAALAVAAARTEFACDACGKVAGTVWTDGRGRVARDSFTSQMSMAISGAQQPALKAALRAGDARALFAVDRELAPFWCPQCATSYSGAHWVRWSVFDDDGWYDSIRGRCPHGHERMLED